MYRHLIQNSTSIVSCDDEKAIVLVTDYSLLTLNGFHVDNLCFSFNYSLSVGQREELFMRKVSVAKFLRTDVSMNKCL